MKKYISSILIPCFLLQICGCYSFRPLDSNEDINLYLDSNDNLKVILKNRNEVFLEGNEYRIIAQQKFFFYGKGILIDKKSNETKSFIGEINEGSIDSIKSMSINSEEYIVAWLKDNSRIAFEMKDVIFNSNLYPDSTYLLIRDYEPPRLINVNEIAAIETEKINWITTIPFSLLSIALLVGVIALGKNLPTGSVLP